MKDEALFAQALEISKITNVSCASRQEADALIKLIPLIVALRQAS